MNELTTPQLRTLESWPEPEFTALRIAAFADFGEPSTLLADVVAEENGLRQKVSKSQEQVPNELRISAFVDDKIAGWSYSTAEGNQLHMINSGVLPEWRRQGIYACLVKSTIAHAENSGFSKIFSRHAPSNNAVTIPKLRLGFLVSGFEYSEVYGPLVQLTYYVGAGRRELYRKRSVPVVSSTPK